MNLCRYLLENADLQRPALLTPDGAFSYTDLARAASAVAGFLSAKGGKKGDRVLLISENSFFSVAGYLGILQAGLVCVPLARKLSAADIRSIAAGVEARFVLVEQKTLRTVLQELPGAAILCDRRVQGSQGPVQGFEDIQNNTGEPQYVELAPDDLAALMFTSGSTGEPKGVMVSIRNIIANSNSIIEYLSLTSADRIMAVLPFHYCFGASLLHTHLRVGGSVVIDPRFMYPDTVLHRMVETRCTGFAGVPSHYQILLRKSSLRRMKFPHLRYVQQAGGHLAPAFVKALAAALPGTDVFIMYGSTEATARLSYLPPEMVDKKPDSVGKAIPGVTLTVLNEDGAPVRPGELGEVVAEGENIAQGYWRDEQETSKFFRNGRLYTGDMATVDQDGFLYIAARARDFIKCRGERVSCRSIEDLLLECDSVVEAAVIGVPDPVLGEAVKAFVVPLERKETSAETRIREHCRLRLPAQLVPREIVLLDSLPKNSSGKVLKTVLREQTALATAH